MTNPKDIPFPFLPQSPEETYVAVELRDADGHEISTGRAWIPSNHKTLTFYATYRVKPDKAPESAVILFLIEEAKESKIYHGRKCQCTFGGVHYHFELG